MSVPDGARRGLELNSRYRAISRGSGVGPKLTATGSAPEPKEPHGVSTDQHYVPDRSLPWNRRHRRHLTHLVRHLPREQFRCLIVAFDLVPNRWVDRIVDSGTPVIHVPVMREYAPAALLRALELSRIIRSNQIDLVQTFHQKSDTYGASVASWPALVTSFRASETPAN